MAATATAKLQLHDMLLTHNKLLLYDVSEHSGAASSGTVIRSRHCSNGTGVNVRACAQSLY
jgi:hypothetical protein